VHLVGFTSETSSFYFSILILPFFSRS